MTKFAFLCLRAILCAIVLGLPGTVFCQAAEKKAAADDVGVVAEAVLVAIRNNDAKLLSNMVDPKGITLGSDSDSLTSKQFRRELSEKRGAYCVIFDISCLPGHKSSAAFSLRQALAKETTLSVSGVRGLQDERAVAVKSSANPNEVLFTIFLRRANGRWVLQQLDYF